MTRSKDGIMRATIRVDYRISEHDQEVVAWVNDYHYDTNPTPTKRLASRAEIVAAIGTGFSTDEFWREEDIAAYWSAHSPQEESGAE